jgi:hypothetical protein
VWNISFDAGLGMGAVMLGALGAGIGIPAAIFWCAAGLVVFYPFARVAALVSRPAAASDSPSAH